MLADEFRCPKRVELPEFEFIPERQPYTLADTIAVIANSRSEDRVKDPVRILFLGDSTMEDTFNWAKCHLSRTNNVVAVNNSSRMYKMARGENWRATQRVKWYRTSEFDVSVSRDTKDGETITRNVRAQVSLARSDDGLETGRTIHTFCEGSDLIILNFGLHFSEVHKEELDKMLYRVLSSLNSCTKSHTAIAFISHPAQHFPGSPNGWYTGAHIEPTRRCIPIGNSIDKADWSSQSLRSTIQSLFWHVLLPSPWTSMKEVLETGKFCRNSRVYARNFVRVHYIPFFDVSASLWDWHLNREHILMQGGVGASSLGTIDCTHLLGMPSFGRAIWDGVYWTALQEFSKHTCVDVSPPRYSVGQNQCGLRRAGSTTCATADRSFEANFPAIVSESIEVFPINFSSVTKEKAEKDVFLLMISR
jgi:hypothetical protein